MRGNKVKVMTWKARVKSGGPSLKGSPKFSHTVWATGWQMVVKSESAADGEAGRSQKASVRSFSEQDGYISTGATVTPGPPTAARSQFTPLLLASELNPELHKRQDQGRKGRKKCLFNRDTCSDSRGVCSDSRERFTAPCHTQNKGFSTVPGLDVWL